MPIAHLRIAFEDWNRNGRYFPRPVDIKQLVDSVAVKKEAAGYPGCDQECKWRHGRGYSEKDILWLWRRYSSMKDQLPNRPMTEAEINTLLAELDRKRPDGPPEWRR